LSLPVASFLVFCRDFQDSVSSLLVLSSSAFRNRFTDPNCILFELCRMVLDVKVMSFPQSRIRKRLWWQYIAWLCIFSFEFRLQECNVLNGKSMHAFAKDWRQYHLGLPIHESFPIWHLPLRMAIEIVNGIIHSSISHYHANPGNLFLESPQISSPWNQQTGMRWKQHQSHHNINFEGIFKRNMNLSDRVNQVSVGFDTDES
jgi:hypothetical protein